ncbi:hypothetical protein ScPMuIL_000434, partial [Solemya velum]
ASLHRSSAFVTEHRVNGGCDLHALRSQPGHREAWVGEAVDGGPWNVVPVN